MQALLLALALGQSSPATVAGADPTAAAGATATALPAARDVTVIRRSDGGFDATLAGQPVSGADFYRAVLRFDLADRYDQARDRKTALGVAALTAPLAGLAGGWIYAAVNYRPPPSCTAIVPQPANCPELAQDNIQWNQEHMKQGLVVGGLSGLAVGLALGWLSWEIELPGPTADEAEALARRYRENQGLAPSPPRSLRLTPTPGGASLSLAWRF